MERLVELLDAYAFTFFMDMKPCDKLLFRWMLMMALILPGGLQGQQSAGRKLVWKTATAFIDIHMNAANPTITVDGTVVRVSSSYTRGGILKQVHLHGTGGDYVSDSAIITVQPGTYTVYLIGKVMFQGGISATVQYQQYQ
jgi:hypothetical protein